MISNLAVVGLLLAAGTAGAADRTTPFFARPVRALVAGHARSLAAAVVGQAPSTCRSSTRGDIMGRPTRTRQADGAMRSQDNPRLREVAQLLTRGAILDRNGLPLATSDRGARSTSAARRSSRALGVAARGQLPRRRRRAAIRSAASTFHLLGDAVDARELGRDATRSSSSARCRVACCAASAGARSTCRRADRRLTRLSARSDDDRAGLRRAAAALGSPRRPVASRRRSACWRAPRDVTLTIDARLQAQAARLLADASSGCSLSRGAVVVLDAGDRRRAGARSATRGRA